MKTPPPSSVAAKPKWLARRSGGENAAHRLIAFPFAGATSRSYDAWRDRLPVDLEFFTVELPGRGARFSEPFCTSAQEAAAGIAEEWQTLGDRPYSVYGHSLGALIAFEFTRLMEQPHRQPPANLLVSGKRAPHLPIAAEGIHALPDDEFVARVMEYEVTSSEIAENPELLELLLPRLRADFAMSECYEFKAGSQITTDIGCFGGEGDPETTAPRLEEWSRQTSTDFSIRRFPGDHFFIFSQDVDFVDSLVEAV